MHTSAETELISAIENMEPDRVKTILIQESANININCRITTNSAATPLWLACTVSLQANNIRGWLFGGFRPIPANHSRVDRLRCIQLLLEYGADVNIRNHEGDTLLFYSIRNCHNRLDVIELLLDYHADVNYQMTQNYLDCKEGDTVLHYAVRQDNVLTVRKILERSTPHMWIRNGNNETVFDIAGRYPCKPILDSLQMSLRHHYFLYLQQRWVNMNHDEHNSMINMEKRKKKPVDSESQPTQRRKKETRNKCKGV